VRAMQAHCIVDARTVRNIHHFLKWLNAEGDAECAAFLRLSTNVYQFVRPELLLRIAEAARRSSVNVDGRDYYGEIEPHRLAQTIDALVSSYRSDQTGGPSRQSVTAS
jgi:hypothetical protein